MANQHQNIFEWSGILNELIEFALLNNRLPLVDSQDDREIVLSIWLEQEQMTQALGDFEPGFQETWENAVEMCQLLAVTRLFDDEEDSFSDEEEDHTPLPSENHIQHPSGHLIQAYAGFIQEIVEEAQNSRHGSFSPSSTSFSIGDID